MVMNYLRAASPPRRFVPLYGTVPTVLPTVFPTTYYLIPTTRINSAGALLG